MLYLAARIVLRFCIDSKCAPLTPMFKVAARAFELFREFRFPGKYFASEQTHAGVNIEHGGQGVFTFGAWNSDKEVYCSRIDRNAEENSD